jgi:acyl-coenzyme A synthetase/AMP-(fatty) acid ligase
LADGAQSADLYEILVFVTERLADYKVPETLEIVDKIPRNTLGKIDRQLLLSMISESGPRDTGLSLQSLVCHSS